MEHVSAEGRLAAAAMVQGRRHYGFRLNGAAPAGAVAPRSLGPAATRAPPRVSGSSRD
jgi:hypothetical protein